MLVVGLLVNDVEPVVVRDEVMVEVRVLVAVVVAVVVGVDRWQSANVPSTNEASARLSIAAVASQSLSTLMASPMVQEMAAVNSPREYLFRAAISALLEVSQSCSLVMVMALLTFVPHETSAALPLHLATISLSCCTSSLHGRYAGTVR